MVDAWFEWMDRRRHCTNRASREPHPAANGNPQPSVPERRHIVKTGSVIKIEDRLPDPPSLSRTAGATIGGRNQPRIETPFNFIDIRRRLTRMLP
jgi:hypothetical protein